MTQHVKDKQQKNAAQYLTIQDSTKPSQIKDDNILECIKGEAEAEDAEEEKVPEIEIKDTTTNHEPTALLIAEKEPEEDARNKKGKKSGFVVPTTQKPRKT